MSFIDSSSALKSFLTEAQGKIILFVGIGNLLRKDDGTGVYISSHLKETDAIKSLTVEASLENYIGKINRINPDLLVLIDCTELHHQPGHYTMLSPSSFSDHTFNTHNISLHRISEFFPMETLLLAIQPRETSFGESLTPEVKAAADEIITVINHFSA